MDCRGRSRLAWTCLALLLFSNLPYVIAWAATPADSHFTGFVFNPIDGHSYLAKMRQGFQGSWRFHLGFTPEESPGASIFLYHLLLGHFARWLGLPLVGVYHGARILTGLGMLMAIYALAAASLEQHQGRVTTFLLTALGSGLGWLLTPLFGIRTADLWVPEAFPAYALMANAHFPLAIGLMALIGVCGLGLIGLEGVDGCRRRRGAWGLTLVSAAVALGIIQPFGLVPTFGALAITVAARAAAGRDRGEAGLPWRSATWVVGAAAAALPYPLYAQWAIRSDPVLAAWHAQNVTPSPPLWDWALSYGLILLLALRGAVTAARRRKDLDVLLLGWVFVTVVGMILPIPLQRRLSIGLGVPLGMLAGMGWWYGMRKAFHSRWRGPVRALIIALTALTPVFLIAVASTAAVGSQASSPDTWLYLRDGEWAALSWLRDLAEAPSKHVVLCSPQMGTFVPAWSGQRVVYGHPFETVDAEARLRDVRAYWTGTMNDAQRTAFLERNRVDTVLLGPRERMLTTPAWEDPPGGELVFQTGTTRIYAIHELP